MTTLDFAAWIRPAARWLGILVAITQAVACQTGPAYQPQPLPPAALARHLTERFAVMVSLPVKSAESAIASGSVPARQGISVATATPVSNDGFFLTAAHGLGGAGSACVIFYSSGSRARRAIAEVCWRDEKADLALLKAPFETPAFYEWTPDAQGLPRGTRVRHGGAATGPECDTGELMRPVNGRSWNRDLRHSLRLEPGDSGGPLITLSGKLVGINQSVGYIGVMDTRFFSESRATRPSLPFLRKSMRSALGPPSAASAP